MDDLRPLHRVLLAIEAWQCAARQDPGTYTERGPTAKAVDRMLGLTPGHARQLVQSVRDRGYVLSMPSWRGNKQRLSLTDAGRAYLRAGCPMRASDG